MGRKLASAVLLATCSLATPKGAGQELKPGRHSVSLVGTDFVMVAVVGTFVVGALVGVVALSVIWLSTPRRRLKVPEPRAILPRSDTIAPLMSLADLPISPSRFRTCGGQHR